MHVCTSADLGPNFVAWAGVVNGSTTALVTSRATSDDDLAQQAVALLRQFDVDCSTCTSCPLGLMRAVI